MDFIQSDPITAQRFDAIVEAFSMTDDLMKPRAAVSVLQLFVDLFARHRYQGSVTKRHLGGNYPLIIMQALRYIHMILCTQIAIDDICKNVNISKYYFCRMFRAHTGHPVLHYINMMRCDYARKLMVENGLNVSEAAYQLGIQNLSYFTRLYKRYMNISPSMERKAKTDSHT